MLTAIKRTGEATITSEEQKSLYNFMLFLQKIGKNKNKKQKVKK